MKCLITGASGFLGREIGRCLADRHDIVGICHANAGHGLRAVDLRDAEAVRTILHEAEPDCVVHCAAYRDPDFCEAHPGEARALNTDTVATLAEHLPASAQLIHISTDYVFDGTKPPYVEDDAPSPINVYGQTKLAAEAHVLGRDRGMVLRVPLLAGAADTFERSGFIEQMVRAVRTVEAQELDNVIIRFPTWIRDVAVLVAFLMKEQLTGLMHFSGRRGATRYAWNLELAQLMGVSADHLEPSEELVARPAARPVNSQLDVKRLETMGYTGFTDFSEAMLETLRHFHVVSPS